MSNLPVVHDFMVMAPVTGYIEYKINGVRVRVDPSRIEALHSTLLELFSTNAYGFEALKRLNDAIEDARLKEPVIPAPVDKREYEVTRLATYKGNEVFDIDDVAYMPVPRCETCNLWGKYAPGDCPVILGPTKADFGCVRWETK